MLFLFNFAHSQQVYLINEDFNNGFPSNWTHYYSSWGGEQWAIDSGALRENSGPYFVPTKLWVHLPVVDLTTASFPFLEFDFAMAVTDPNIQFSVFYTIDSIWHPLLTYTDTSTSIPIHTSIDGNWKPLITDYQTISIDLAQFGNESNIRFGFVYDYLNAWASGVWYIDNVKIFDSSPVGIVEHSESFSFQLSPNPTTGIIRFIPNSPIKNATLKITNATGLILHEKVIDSDTENIDLSGYPSGIYFVNCIHSNRTFTRQIIVD